MARGVLFGYGALAAQIFYSFASIPLALAYLSKAEFGMWSLISTLGTYLMLAEMGMTNSVIRHLFDCKDGKDPGKYGRFFAASAMALGLVSIVVFLIGLLAAWVSAPVFKIPPHLHREYFWVMLGQTGLLAVTMATRMLGAPLYVHHRQDLSQINLIVLFTVYYFALRYGFRAGWGIYAMLANQVLGVIWVVGFNVVACFRLGFYPARKDWGFPRREEWASVWRYSRALFVAQVGGMVVMSLPQLLVARLLGLEAAAAWAVCTRPFAILRQLVMRPFEVAMPMLCDIFVRGDMKSVTKRWGEISQLVLAFSGAAFAVAAVNNARFVSLWTGGRMQWGEIDHWLFALHSYVYVAATLAFGSIGLDKSVGPARFVPLVQAIATAVLALPLTRLWGIEGLMVATTLPFVFGMIYFGFRYLGTITGFRPGRLAMNAMVRPSMALPIAVLAASSCAHLAGALPGYVGLVTASATGAAFAMAAMMFLGVSREVRDEIWAMASRTFKRILPRPQTEA